MTGPISQASGGSLQRPKKLMGEWRNCSQNRPRQPANRGRQSATRYNQRVRSRKFWTIAVLAVLLAGTSGGGYWWWGAMPPRAGRRLPEAAGYGYTSGAALRAARGPA